MQRVYRLTQRASFNYIYKKGKLASTVRMTMYAVNAHNIKIGITVGKKVGNSVIRSRVKRRIGERFRLLIPQLESRNFVVVARAACATADSAVINEDLQYLLTKLGALTEK